MRSFDYSPLYRTTVGFDRLFDMLENSVRSDWPPYNIEKNGDNDYRITMAIAGFGLDEVELVQNGPELSVIGQRKPDQQHREILHRGLAIGNFKQVFKLADHVKVKAANIHNGLLSVDLVREVPEELKPRRIEIGSNAAAVPLQDGGNKQSMDVDAEPQRKVA
ncbi:Hsp20 family protein [Mesorhizobium sp. BR115XR7A]|uniref:Hsp20 family protein n=1 Tax=Mesorhizobium sp. BR115XR7A TaxID=2876645 RepID=UPI001CD0017F|nr:Hsp20 family protein [Mesorhizobium sp. BR115XR7A]MBZ9910021.1 Hsp20 family protein [Mesorhizobium sp. BR115XR7A]MBZ9933443.1 Hsp20 family protein [Mesorhizobium sp. BR1-1-5]